MPAPRPASGVDIDVSIVTSAHDVADARLHREVTALQRAGLSVEVIGLGDPAGGPPGAVVVTRPRRGARGRAWDAARLPFVAQGRVVVLLDPDPVPAALLARLVRRRAVVVDVHEDYASLLRDRSWATGAVGAAARAAARGVSRAASRADLVSVADEHVPPSASRHRMVLRNLPDPSLLPPPARREAAPRALYVGDVRASRGLWAMLAALEAAPGWTLDIVGPVAAADAEAVEQWRRTSSASPRVRWHGRRPPQEAWALAAGAWVGLLLLEPTPAFVAAVPSKLYEYLACGLGVVATDLPRTAELLAGGGGVTVPVGAVGEASAVGEAAAAVLRGWEADPAALDAVVASGEGTREQLRAGAEGYDAWAAAIAVLARRRRE